MGRAGRASSPQSQQWRPANDSSEVRDLLLGRGHRNDGQPGSLEPRSSLRSEMLPMDQGRGSIGYALGSMTQRSRSTHEPVDRRPPPSPSNALEHRDHRDKKPERQRSPSAQAVDGTRSRSPESDRALSSRARAFVNGNAYSNGERTASPRPFTPERTPRDDGSQRSTSRQRLQASSSSQQLQAEAEGPQTPGRSPRAFGDKCSTSSPIRDSCAWAGKPQHPVSPRVIPQRESTPDVRFSDLSPECAPDEIPKGRRVENDKNAPSEYWMANPSSNLKRDIKYDWQDGQPELQWKRHVPGAIPVSAMKEKRPADPQGRPWVRQFSKISKNVSSDPLALRQGQGQGHSRLQDQLDEGKRLYGDWDVGKNRDGRSISPRMVGQSPRYSLSPRSDCAGFDCRRRDAHWDEASPLSQRSSRRQYVDLHSNRPSDPQFSPVGVPPPVAASWSERTPSPRSARETREGYFGTPSGRRRTPSPMRLIQIPSDLGVSPITGKRRSHYLQMESGWRK